MQISSEGFMRVLRFGIGLTLVVVFFSGSMVVGQSSPLDAAAALAGQTLNGDWKNVDSHSRGLVRIVVEGTKVHPYGACQPAACDWGTARAQSFASAVDARDTFALLANSDSSFDRNVLTISLETDGRLRVQVFTHYTDHSGRADHSSVEYFLRQ